jgi:hypothetical protein
MKRFFAGLAVFSTLLCISVQGFSADARAGTLTCVGLYSETSDGYVSYRVGTADWVVIKVGDVVPANAEIRINVDRDWVELSPYNNPNAVYEIVGSESGVVTKKVVDILKLKPKPVGFPKPSGSNPDPKFKDKLVVTQYLGRQIYSANPDASDQDIKYGDVLDIRGKVRIIAINNTLTLMNANGQVTTVVGPLRFDVQQVLMNKQLYKFLNVLK